MKGQRYTNRRTVLKSFTAAVVGGGGLAGTANAAPGKARGRRNEVEIVAKHDEKADEHLFEMDKREIEEGWTTLVFDNQTEHTHFAYLQKIPQLAIEKAKKKDIDLLDYWVEQVTDPFQVFMDFLLGKTDLPPKFPTWFGDIEPSGGAGLTSPQMTSRGTVYLEPGKYQVECYVKNDKNEFHSYLGMVDLLTVTDGEARAPEPESTLNLQLSNEKGISVESDVRPGQHIVGVTFDSQQTYSHLLGHDVHLVRFDDETDAEEVNDWMDWSNGQLSTPSADPPDQLVSDGTEPGTFLGGIQDIGPFPETGRELPETGYFHVNLKPGDYALVAEVPDPEPKGLLETFSVP